MQMKLLSLCLVCLMSTSAVGQERTWSDDTGKFSVKAELVKIENDRAVLKKSDGEIIKVPLSRLSKKDQDFVSNWKPEDSPNVETGSKETNWLADVKVKATAKREPGFDYDFNSKEPMPEIAVDVEILGEAAARAISFGMLKIESFKDGEGNDLPMPEEKFGPDLAKEMQKVTTRGDDFIAEHPKNGIRFNIKSIDKPGKVTKVSEVNGQVDVLTGGTSKTVTIPDVSNHENGDVESETLKELGIKCDFKRSEQQIELKVEGDVSNLASVQFLDGKGKAVKPDGWTSGGWKESWQYSYDFEKIPKADLVLDFRIAPESVTIPFEAKNIKIKKQR